MTLIVNAVWNASNAKRDNPVAAFLQEGSNDAFCSMKTAGKRFMEVGELRRLRKLLQNPMKIMGEN